MIGESADRGTVQEIREFVQSHNEVEHVNEVLTLHMGPEFILVNLSVSFIDTATAVELEHAISRLDRGIKEAHPEVKRIFVEAEARRKRPPVP